MAHKKSKIISMPAFQEIDIPAESSTSTRLLTALDLLRTKLCEIDTDNSAEIAQAWALVEYSMIDAHSLGVELQNMRLRATVAKNRLAASAQQAIQRPRAAAL